MDLSQQLAQNFLSKLVIQKHQLTPESPEVGPLTNALFEVFSNQLIEYFQSKLSLEQLNELKNSHTDNTSTISIYQKNIPNFESEVFKFIGMFQQNYLSSAT